MYYQHDQAENGYCAKHCRSCRIESLELILKAAEGDAKSHQELCRDLFQVTDCIPGTDIKEHVAALQYDYNFLQARFRELVNKLRTEEALVSLLRGREASIPTPS
jgi:hypothetical protein